MEYVLLTLLIILTFVAFFLLKCDPLSPGFLMCASFTFSALCMIYNVQTWAIDTDYKTVFVIVLGCFSFVVGNTICQMLFSRRMSRAAARNRINYGCQEFKGNEYFHISKNYVYFVFFIDCIILLLYFVEVIRIAGFSSFSVMMYTFRQMTGFEGASVSPIVNMLVRISKAFTSVFLFYFINNILAQKSLRSQRYLLLPVIPDLMCGLLTGGRFRLLQLILGPIVMYGILRFIKTGKRIKVRPGLIIKIMLIAVGSMLVFYQIKGLVGRVADKDLISYVTEYFGGPIELFDVVLRGAKPYIEPEVIGRNTFASVYRYLDKFLNMDIGPSANPGFLTSRTLINLGNVFTCFFNYYADFGIVGVVILSFLSGTIWSSLYYKCLSSYKSFIKIVYAFAFHGLIFQFYDEMTFMIFLSIDNWMTFFFIYLVDKYIGTRVDGTKIIVAKRKSNIHVQS